MNAKFYLTLVEEFHQAYRYHYPSPETPVFDEAPLRVRTMLEELSELLASTSKQDELDALCDFQYFLSGTVLCMGFRSMFLQVLPATIQHPSAGLSHIQALHLWVSCFDNAAKTKSERAAVTAICKLQRALLRCVDQRGFALVFDLAFAEVHRKNMSKFWTEAERIEYLNRCLQAGEKPSYTFEDTERGLICRRADGKIQKPASFTPPDLTPFVVAK